MKQRITTSLSFLVDYWTEHVEPLLKKGWSIIGIFKKGVETIEKENA